LITSELSTRAEGGALLPALLWRFDRPMTVASTAAAGGGLGARQWIINAQVRSDYARRDLARHLDELAGIFDLVGPGVGMLTASDVTGVRHAQDGGSSVAATVGLALPTWAAAPDEPITAPMAPGTINIVAFLPEPLTEGALLNCLCTATEAKSQALSRAGIDGTGTASDAVTVVCPSGGEPQPFGGPRSLWGGRLARAVHKAVLAGCRSAVPGDGNQ
jgi:adenosylcobinamide amidohydrolase